MFLFASADHAVKPNCPVARPVLSGKAEDAFRRSMIMAKGSLAIPVERSRRHLDGARAAASDLAPDRAVDEPSPPDSRRRRFRASSSEAETSSREENAVKQKIQSTSAIQRNAEVLYCFGGVFSGNVTTAVWLS